MLASRSSEHVHRAAVRSVKLTPTISIFQNMFNELQNKNATNTGFHSIIDFTLDIPMHIYQALHLQFIEGIKGIERAKA